MCKEIDSKNNSVGSISSETLRSILGLSQDFEERLITAVQQAVSDAVERSLIPTKQDPLMNIGQVAKRLSVHDATIRRLVNEGALIGIKVLGALRFDPRDVEDYLDRERGVQNDD